MKRLGSLLAAVLLCLTAASAPQRGGAAPAGPPDTLEARHPIHVRGNATTAPTGYAPSQVRHAYGFDRLTADGSLMVLGIVDAYDDPTITGDLQTFITAFGLKPMHGLSAADPCTAGAGPHPCFQKVFAGGKPRTDGGWSLEISLDVEWSHAIAPGADIVLVEAANGRVSSLLSAVDVAAANGARVVSMSWGGSEFSTEAGSDFHFNHSGVTFVASSGDAGTGVIWPAASPYVVSVGGTTLPLDGAGNLAGSETAWSGSGGGVSAYEAEPGYQSGYPIPADGGKRGIPDVSYDGDPSTGFSVYDSTNYQGQKGWFRVGGTSAGAPQWSALFILADQGRAALSSNNTGSSPVYGAAASAVYGSNYRDITAGSNGTCAICAAKPGYDFVTGLGSPLANSLVPYLNTH
jgi:subtilase family serine protease